MLLQMFLDLFLGDPGDKQGPPARRGPQKDPSSFAMPLALVSSSCFALVQAGTVRNHALVSKTLPTKRELVLLVSLTQRK